MFANLMRSELSRLRYRRRAWGSMILMMLAGLLVPSMWMGSIRRPTPDERLLAYIEFVRITATNECTGCTLAEMGGWWDFERAVNDGIGAGALLLAFIAFIVVVTYVAADFSSGAMATQLTFTPRRSTVLTARMLACGVLGALLMLIGMLTATAVTVIGFLAVNGVGSIGAAPGLLDVLIGAVVYGWFIGLVASLLAFIIPNAPLAMAAAIGVLIGNAVIDLGKFERMPTWVHRLLPIRTEEAMVQGSSVAVDMMGEAVVVITRWQSLVFHSVVVAVLFAVAAFVFERRDVRG